MTKVRNFLQHKEWIRGFSHFQLWAVLGKAWALMPDFWSRTPQAQLDAKAAQLRHFPQSLQITCTCRWLKQVLTCPRALTRGGFLFQWRPASFLLIKDKISIDGKGRCFQEHLPDLLSWLQRMLSPHVRRLLKEAQPFPFSESLGKSRNGLWPGSSPQDFQVGKTTKRRKLYEDSPGHRSHMKACVGHSQGPGATSQDTLAATRPCGTCPSSASC